MSKKFRNNAPSYNFEFPTEQAAIDFMNYACSLSTSAIIQHSASSDGTILPNRVTISGNNIIFNLTFRSLLADKVKELKGTEV